MKKLLILISLVLFCFAGIARDLGSSWVVTNNGKMDCKKINLGYNKARILFENGQKAVVNFDNISSLSRDGKVLVKLRLYQDNKPTNQMAFMELIKTWNDLSLYRLGFRYIGSADPMEVTYRYYLYKGQNFHLQLDERTLQNTCINFGLTYADL